MSESIAAKYEKRLGVNDLGEWLYNQYIIKQQSYRQIMALMSINSARTIKRLLEHYSIPIRYGGEAVKTQWVNNPKRREAQGEIARKLFTGNTQQRLPDQHFQDKLDVLGLDLISREIKNSYTIVTYRCRECGYIGTKSSKNLNTGCNSPSCIRDSKGEMFVEKYLKHRGIPYEPQATEEGCEYKAPLRFDFRVFLNQEKILIEYQGIQHFQPIEVFGGEAEFKEVCLRDEIKRNFCKEEGITLIEIPYTVNTYEQVAKFLDDRLTADVR